ncbi:MAG: hypothetical protein Hyperionvirus17_16 [Hyperionvirus sp.]|uniref:Uncharacterized protein n=1 Tax=Hyperionvirus sp. TaxID=2487770 RepID=A0A3G5AA05_9VIRU|nr:MAG: hypothetical protein Hyperionvirus17_16 [Hyperionvirus sp.]
MSQLNVQDLTEKYKKYLGKLEDASRRRDMGRINLCGKKLKMYGTLLQSGGELSATLERVMKQVEDSLNALTAAGTGGDITKAVAQLKDAFDKLSKQYVDNTMTFIKHGNMIKDKVRGIEIQKVDVSSLDKLIEGYNLETLVDKTIYGEYIKKITATDNKNKYEDFRDLFSIFGTLPDAIDTVNKSDLFGATPDEKKKWIDGFTFVDAVEQMKSSGGKINIDDPVLKIIKNESDPLARAYVQEALKYVPLSERKGLGDKLAIPIGAAGAE